MKASRSSIMMKSISLVCCWLLLLQHGALAGKLSIRGNQVLEDGKPITMHGINYFGFNNAQTMVDGLWAGKTSLTKDFSTQVYRQQLLGFNAVRLPFSFRDFNLPGRTDYNWCTPASEDDIRKSVTPPGVDPYAKPLPKPRVPLTVGNGQCNLGMPVNVFDRFLWVINLYARAGFKVVIDNHVWLEDPTAYEDPDGWVAGWARLAAAISKDPVSRGVVMYDLVNEPDNKKIFWRARGGRPSLATLYVRAMDSIYKVQPDAIFVLEGTGQITYAIPSGDGFVTDTGVINSFKTQVMKTSRYEITGIEDPNFFFKALLTKPYAQNVIWGPHFYAQSVIPFALPKRFMTPPGLFKRMSDSFGYLTTKGYCSGKCLRWPVLMGEFSAPHAGAPGDYATMDGLVQYFNNAGAGNDGRHTPISNWFFWAWNDNTPDTNGGIVKSDWASIDWSKVNWLRKIGLRPWYL